MATAPGAPHSKSVSPSGITLTANNADRAAAVKEPLLTDDEELELITRELEYGHQKNGPINTDGTATWSNEVLGFLGYMIPIFGFQILWRYFSVLGPVTVMGQYGANYLAGATLATTTLSLFCVVPANAATSALDTLSTQAHGGEQTGTVKDLNRLYSLRVYLVMWILMLFLIPLIYWFEPIFLLLRVDEEAAHIAATYMRYVALGIPGWFSYECLRKYCQAQGRMVGPAAAVICAGICSLPILQSGYFGVYTAGAALGFFWAAIFVFELIYAYIFLPVTTFQDMPAFNVITQDLRIVIDLTLAGFVSIGSDFFAWEVLNLLSAWLGLIQLAANSVFLSSAHFFFALPGALMNASATRVGNYLGKNEPRNARTAAFTSLAMSFATASTSAIAIAINSRSWALIFTSDAKVLDIVQRIMPFFCFIAMLDAIQGVGSGILRGAGKPFEIAQAMAMAHYLVGLPLAVLFAFPFHGGVFGLWLGFGVGLTLVSLRLCHVIFRNDWHQCAMQAQEHIARAGDQNHQIMLDETVGP